VVHGVVFRQTEQVLRRQTVRTIAVLLGFLLCSCSRAGEAGAAYDLTPERRQELEKKAAALNEEGDRYFEAGNYARAIEAFRQSLEISRVLYPKAKYPNGHADLARSISNLGYMHQVAGEYGKAEPLYYEALEMDRALYPKAKYPDGHAALARSINNLGLLYKATGDHGKAEPFYLEALAIYRVLYPKAKYPNGHSDLSRSISNLGLLHIAAGEYGKAEPLLREALQMDRALYPKAKYPDGHPDLARRLNNLGLLYNATGEYSKAEAFYREALDMCRALYPKARYPNGHPDLARSISNLGLLHRAAGEYGKAEPLYHEALEQRRVLYPKAHYPNGHPSLARSINSLALVHIAAGEYGKAEPLLQEALEMDRLLYPRAKYPDGHADLARSISNLGLLHKATGEYGKAERFYREALDMCRALYPKAKYPNGHPDLAASFHHLGALHQDTGEYGKAEPLLREDLDIYRALYPKGKYPDGHPNLLDSLERLAGLYHAAGEYEKVEVLCREALDMTRALLRRHADLAAEAEALNFAATQPLIRDALLSVTHDRDNAAAVYDDLWDSRALLTQLQEQRHRQLAASLDPALRDLADQLRLARLSLSRRLLRPLNNPDANRADIARLTEAKEDLEKRLAVRMKLPRLPTSKVPASRRLSRMLPAGTCFVDLYRYTHFQYDSERKGKRGEKRTLRYVAFVVRPGSATARIELGEADTIGRAWADWRNAITATRPDEAAERKAAATLAHHVWEPLRKELPRDLQTVYLTADGSLHQVPWGALPGTKAGTVLLEEYAICLVPHGPFLLQRLQENRTTEEATAGRLLAVGGIDYQDCAAADAPVTALREAALPARGIRWPQLKGTDRERQEVAALARRTGRLEVTERSGIQATTEQFQVHLPLARYAHVATHGFFADPKFRSALQIDAREFGTPDMRDRRGGARSPLSLSGLVFAGANRSGKEAAEDRGILTAEGLIGLRMEGLELAVLSACETGLGAYGDGEGVYGLQRAFHVAGCRNVVASLWKVDDDATQTLMALFYANLWQKKMDPAEALRQAQLTMYRNPTAVAVARRRGVDFTESDLPKVVAEPVEKGKHTPPAQWAAFTFSGVRPVKPE
jgi:CHAT domain-containing protein/Tfp pilus assembly protein PilF